MKKKTVKICVAVILLAIVISLIAIIGLLMSGRNQGISTPQKSRDSDKFVGTVTEVKEYRSQRMKNGMKVVLVSDPQAPNSAVSLRVAAGTLHEDRDMPGIAHLEEHILACLGSELWEFILAFDVQTNLDSTHYGFAMHHSRLKELMDKIAQCMYEPKFSDAAIQSEMAAVQSEYIMGMAYDTMRLEIIDMATAKEGHPYHSKFRCGNAKSFGNNTKKVLHKLADFYHKYYTGNWMSLAVTGNFTLNSLETAVRKSFGKIQSGKKNLPPTFGSPFGNKETGVTIFMNSEAGAKTLRMDFPVPENMTKNFQQRAEYYTHLINHPGKAQLYRHLVIKGLITSMEAYCHQVYHGFFVFRIQFELTEWGQRQIGDIVRITFEYLAILRKTGPKEWVWDEIVGVQNAVNKFKNPDAPFTFVSTISGNLLEFPMNETISKAKNGDAISTQFSAPDLRDMLKIMVPKNMRLYRISQLHQDKKNFIADPFYGTVYSMESFSSDEITKWELDNASVLFKFPEMNIYIPKNFTLKPNQTGATNDSSTFQLSTIAIFEQDDKLKVPKAFIRIGIFSQFANDTIQNDIIVLMMYKSISEFIDLNSRAGIHVELDYKDEMLLITVHGFSDGIEKVVLKVMKQIANFDVWDGTLYKSAIEQLEQYLKRSMYLPPCENFKVDNILDIEGTSFEQVWAELQEVKIDMMADYWAACISRLNFRWVIYGNIIREDAEKMVASSEEYFLKKGTLAVEEVKAIKDNKIQICSGKSYIYKVTKDSVLPYSSCVRVILQASMQNTTDAVMIHLLNSVISLPFLRQLRKEGHLGYVVHSDTNAVYGILEFRVQGEKHPAFVNERINTFIEIFMDTLTEKKFREHKEHVYQTLKSKSVENIFKRGEKLWNSLSYRGDGENALETLEKIEFEDLQKFYKEFTGIFHGMERRLTLQYSRGDYLGETYTEKLSPDNSEDKTKREDSYTNQFLIANLTQWKQMMQSSCVDSNGF